MFFGDAGFWAMDTEKLIEAIKRCPALFDKTKHCYHDKVAKENCWLEVSSDTGMSGELSM